MDNCLGIKFKDNYFFNQKIPKEYFLKKININKYPKMKNNLNTFFNDCNKYFETSYDDKYIIVGKKYNNNDNNQLINPFSENLINKNKNKNKKLFKRMTLKKPISLKASNESSRNTKNKNILEEKKKAFTSVEESSLKQGQRFIDDKEIDNLFNLFKEVRRINKNKINNFITVRELSETKNNNIFNFRRASNNFSNNRNLINIKNYYNQSQRILNIDKKKKTELKSNRKNQYDKSNNINDIDYYNTTSTGFTGSFKEDSIKNNILSIDFNERNNINNKFQNNYTKNIKERKKIIRRQNQYISPELDKTIKNKFANILSLQEKTFICQNSNKNIQSKINQYLSSRLKFPKNRHLLLKDESYRPNLEIKLKLNHLQKKLNPDKVYDWYKDLHLSENYFKTYNNLPSVETIRNPKNMIYSSTLKNLFIEKNDYLKKILPKKLLRNLIKDFSNTQKNYDSLCVNGVNLLKYENDIFKKLKGRKIINDFERLMSPSKIKSRDIYSHIDKNIFMQKTKSSNQISDSI